MYEPTPTTYSATPDETLIAEAIEALPAEGDRHHTVVELEHQTVCLSVARAPAQEDCWVWFSAAAAERAELTSERLLPLVSAGNFDGWFYVAHDIGQAVPLSEYRRISELSTARSLALLLGIAHALDDAVSQGKPPCEVTPDSVFLDPRLGAMVGDLGVARGALGNPAAGADHHAPWVAPEVLRGEDAHPRSAVYSFGAIAYTLLTGGAPHTGTPQQIANAAPPRLSEARPDLPATLDTVFAVAMAPDPRKRYATCAEARHLLNLVIYGAPSVPAPEPSPRFRRSAPAKKAQSSPPRQVPRIQPAVEENPRTGKVLVTLLVGGALVAGAVAGTVAAGGDDPVAPHQTATAAGLSVELPKTWRQRPAEAGLLEAYPARDAGSGLKIEVSKERLSRSDEATPVLLGDNEAWHHSPVRSDDGSRVAGYVIPTKSGKLTITCTASPGSPANTLAVCERTASTLDVGKLSPLTLGAVRRAQDRWRLASNQLKADRAEGRAELARAATNTEQIEAASSLAGIYEHAARRFAALSNGQPVVNAARETAAAYRELSRAASSNTASVWVAARAKVRAAEAKLSRVVSAG
jgi:hypothetical protein